MTKPRERTLRTGTDASFAWDFAVLQLPPRETDPDGARILHEISHVLTFAGTDFYEELASAVPLGEELTFGETSENNSAESRDRAFARFCEAIPHALRALGERTYQGTSPDEVVARQLAECVRQYRKIFDPLWPIYGLEIDKLWSPASQIGAISAQALFDRFPLLTMAHAVLDATVSGSKRERLPRDIVADLHTALTEQAKLPIPAKGMTVSQHMQQLLGIGQRTMVTMFNDHFRLAKVLLEAPDENIQKHLGLLPAVVGLEFLMGHWPEGVQSSLFSNTADQPLRRQSYQFRRLRDDATRAS